MVSVTNHLGASTRQTHFNSTTIQDTSPSAPRLHYQTPPHGGSVVTASARPVAATTEVSEQA